MASMLARTNMTQRVLQLAAVLTCLLGLAPAQALELGEITLASSLNQPLEASIALKAIDVVMNEGLAENVRTLTPLFEAGMARLAEHPNIGEWRGKGLMGALEAVADKATKRPFDGSLSVSERIANACTDQGLICRPLGQATLTIKFR